MTKQPPTRQAPSGCEAAEDGLQAVAGPNNSAESLGSLSTDSVPPMQAESTEHNKFGQPVVSDLPVDISEDLLTPAQAAGTFQVPEYLLPKACSDGRLHHLR